MNPEHPIEPPEGPGFIDVLSRFIDSQAFLRFFLMAKISYKNDKFIAQLDNVTGSIGESIKWSHNNKEIVQPNLYIFP